MKVINIDTILLFGGSLLILVSIVFRRPKLSKKIRVSKNILSGTLILGIIFCLSSFFIVFPFTKSKSLLNNKLISGEYLDRLKDESKLQAITKELIKTKFAKSDTIFFKGIYNKEKPYFAVITIYNIGIADTIITFTFSATYTNNTDMIKYDKNFGTVTLSTNTIDFETNQKSKIEVNDYGKLKIIPLLKKDSWEYVEF